MGILGRDKNCIALKIIVHSQKKEFSRLPLYTRGTRGQMGVEGRNIYFLKNVFFQTQQTSKSNDTSPFLTHVVRNSPERILCIAMAVVG